MTQRAEWLLEDSRVIGGVRAGSQSELAILGCHITGARGQLTQTGVLAQGSARVLVRASIVDGHERSGLTVQHSSRLWLDHCCVAGNALTGVKLTSRSPCVVSCCSVVRNGHFGLMLRDRATATLSASEFADNGTAGVVAIQRAITNIDGCEVVDNDTYGIVCQHEATLSLERCLVQRNGGPGIRCTQEAQVHAGCTSVVDNRGPAINADRSARVALLGEANHFDGNARETARDDEPSAAASTFNHAAEAGAADRHSFTTALDVGPRGEVARREQRSVEDAAAWHYAMASPFVTNDGVPDVD